MRKASSNCPPDPLTQMLGDCLGSPPAGVPAEVVEAFGGPGGSGQGVSPYLFFHIVQQAPVAVSITDAQAKILYVNRAFETLTGYHRLEIIGQNESILSNKATPSKVYRELWSTITGKATWTGTLVNRRKNGDAYLAELTIAPVLNAEGEIANFLGMHRDVGEVHRLQRQLEYQKALIESVLDAAPVVVALIDRDGKVLLDNQEYKKLLGDLRGQEPAQLLVSAMTRSGALTLAKAADTRRELKDIEVRLDMAGGARPRWFSCSGTWIEEPNPAASTYFAHPGKRRACLLLLATELTEQRREHERARVEHLRASLAEQQLLCSMREALSAATFQMQKPLNLANAASTMLRQRDAEADQGGPVFSVLDQIADAAQQALDMLRNAQPEDIVEPQRPVNLNGVIQDVLSLSTEQFLAGGIVVEWLPLPVLPALDGKIKRLRALFNCLVDNAVQALSEARQPHKEIRISTAERDGFLEVMVQDNGPGIAPEKRLAVFEPLYSAWKHKRGHAGMGLAIAQEIVVQHGGDIRIDSEYADGCLIRVTFPPATQP